MEVSSSDPDSGDERDFAAFLASARPPPPVRIKQEPLSETSSGGASHSSLSPIVSATAPASSAAKQNESSQVSAAATQRVSQTEAAAEAALRSVRVQHYVPVSRPPQIQAQRLLLPILSEEQVSHLVI